MTSLFDGRRRDVVVRRRRRRRVRFPLPGIDPGEGGRGGGGHGGGSGGSVSAAAAVVVVGVEGGGSGRDRGRHPGVGEDHVQRDPGAGLDPQAPLDEVAALSRQPGAEVDLGGADLLVLLEGDVAADHVVEEDAQGPHGGRRPVVPVEADPLGRGVHSRSWKRDFVWLVM